MPTLVARASVGACPAMIVEWMEDWPAQTSSEKPCETKSVHGPGVRIALMGNTTSMTATASSPMHWLVTINRRSFTGPVYRLQWYVPRLFRRSS